MVRLRVRVRLRAWVRGARESRRGDHDGEVVEHRAAAVVHAHGHAALLLEEGAQVRKVAAAHVLLLRRVELIHHARDQVQPG